MLLPPTLVGHGIVGDAPFGIPTRRTTKGTLVKRLLVGSTMLGAALLMTHPAGAQDATGPCTATATLSNGVVVNPYDPAMAGTVYEVPIQGSASYEGSVEATTTPRPISGRVAIQGPPGFGDFTITDQWTWSSENATTTSKTGTANWDLPAALPRGVEMKVTGVHRENGVAVCEGTVLIKLEGGMFDSPVGYIAVAGTLLSAAGVAGAMVVKR
jgi:hypothetical protein